MTTFQLLSATEGKDSSELFPLTTGEFLELVRSDNLAMRGLQMVETNLGFRRLCRLLSLI